MIEVNHECYVDFEVAKLLKEAGFDWECRCYYETSGKLRGKNSGSFNNYNSPLIWQNNGNTDTQLYSAPTLDVAQRWLREVKKISVEVRTKYYGSEYTVSYIYELWPIDTSYTVPNDESKFIDYSINSANDIEFQTYEEAQEAGEKRALELILEKEK